MIKFLFRKLYDSLTSLKLDKIPGGHMPQSSPLIPLYPRKPSRPCNPGAPGVPGKPGRPASPGGPTIRIPLPGKPFGPAVIF